VLQLTVAPWYHNADYTRALILKQTMVNVSKTQFGQELRKKAWQRFYKLVKRSPSEETFVKNLAALFTSSEITMIEKRIAIPLLLTRGLSYREIRRAIDVSPATISFVKHQFTKRPELARKHSSS